MFGESHLPAMLDLGIRPRSRGSLDLIEQREVLFSYPAHRIVSSNSKKGLVLDTESDG